MNEKITKTISLKTDENGFFGRACPVCKGYFKIKTEEVPDRSRCPYCDHEDVHDEFITKDQMEFIEGHAINAVLPHLDNEFKKIERSSTNSLFKFEFSPLSPVPIKEYKEKILETTVTCSKCALAFSIYGVFSNCPRCGQLNAKTIFEKSIEVSKKKLLLSQDKQTGRELKSDILKDALLGGISSFDALGKALRAKHPTRIPHQPKNIFQNLAQLNKCLTNEFGKTIDDYATTSNPRFFLKMFQVRHIYEHAAGVIDDDFVRALPEFSSKKGRRYLLVENEISMFLDELRVIGTNIFHEFEGR